MSDRVCEGVGKRIFYVFSTNLYHYYTPDDDDDDDQPTIIRYTILICGSMADNTVNGIQNGYNKLSCTHTGRPMHKCNVYTFELRDGGRAGDCAVIYEAEI